MPFAVERADEATWNGDAAVLSDYKRDHPLFRERWTGEKTGWTPSLRIQYMRAGEWDKLYQLMEEEVGASISRVPRFMTDNPNLGVTP